MHRQAALSLGGGTLVAVEKSAASPSNNRRESVRSQTESQRATQKHKKKNVMLTRHLKLAGVVSAHAGPSLEGFQILWLVPCQRGRRHRRSNGERNADNASANIDSKSQKARLGYMRPWVKNRRSSHKLPPIGGKRDYTGKLEPEPARGMAHPRSAVLQGALSDPRSPPQTQTDEG